MQKRVDNIAEELCEKNITARCLLYRNRICDKLDTITPGRYHNYC